MRTSVYQYFDVSGVLLYVGVTGRGHRRAMEHAGSKEWWPYVASSSICHFETRDAALAEEERLITTYSPPFNTVHNHAYRKVRGQYKPNVVTRSSGDLIAEHQAFSRIAAINRELTKLKSLPATTGRLTRIADLQRARDKYWSMTSVHA